MTRINFEKLAAVPHLMLITLLLQRSLWLELVLALYLQPS